jgi:hypothetical protein
MEPVLRLGMASRELKILYDSSLYFILPFLFAFSPKQESLSPGFLDLTLMY